MSLIRRLKGWLPYKMRAGLFLMAVMVSQAASALVSTLPASAEQPSVYVLHNPSTARVYLDKVMSDDPGVEAGWASVLDPGHYSVLVISQPMGLRCVDEKVVGCSPCRLFKVRALHAWQTSEIAPGSYWLAENQVLR
jgi:hypothetical protein